MSGGRRPALSDQLPPHHGRLRDRLREETESAILDAAEQAIGEEGLNAARVERIAARAGVAVGTLYNHFRDRSTLVNALYEARAGELHDLLAASLAATADRPAAEQVRVMLAAMVRHARDHGRLFSALMQDNDGPSRLRPPTSARSDMGTFAEAIVARGIANGEFREDPQAIFAEALVAGARLVLARAIEGKTSEAEVDALAEIYVRGVSR